MDTCSLHSYLQPPPSPFIQIHIDTTPTIKVSKYLDTHTNETNSTFLKVFSQPKHILIDQIKWFVAIKLMLYNVIYIYTNG